MLPTSRTHPKLFKPNGRLKSQRFLKIYAPDFCWCTWFDLYLMAEQLDEDIDPFVFKVSLRMLLLKGWFIVKEDPSVPPSTSQGGKRRKLYLRIKNL